MLLYNLNQLLGTRVKGGGSVTPTPADFYHDTITVADGNANAFVYDDFERTIWAYSNDNGKTWTWDFLTEEIDAYMYADIIWDVDRFNVVVAYVPEGGILYVEAGALKYRGSSGTVTTIGAA